RYVFDEASADSRARAAALLAPFAARVEFRRLADFAGREDPSEGEDFAERGDFAEPLENAVVFSNELLDAFPVHRVSMRGGRLRAFRGPEFVEDVLLSPGEQDLTTTVNWTQVVAAGEGAGLQTVALERLDSFLLRAGLVEQLERECALAVTEAEVARLRLDAREMILPGAMASHFQVLVQKKG